jgi:SAM-dependent methyltransferase
MSAGLLRRCSIAPGARWLDLGCGPGSNFALAPMLRTKVAVGLDLSPIALAEARRKDPSAQLVQADLNQTLAFGDGTFDVVTVFNVLYHDWIASEAAVVGEIARVLRPGGVALITEPAFAILSREMDAAAMGHRRYRLSDLVSWCRRAGLKIEFASYFTSFGFPLLLGIKGLRRLRPGTTGEQGAVDMKPISPPLNRVMRAIADMEAGCIVRGVRVPFGTTAVCVARRSDIMPQEA